MSIQKSRSKDIFSQVPVINDLQKSFQAIDALIFPFIKAIQEVAKAIQPIITKAALAFINCVDTMLLKSELVRNYWIIMDTKLLNILKDSDKRSIKDIEEIIINYYKERKYSNLKELFNPYRTNKLFENRFPIIDSCITILHDTPLEISSAVVVPTILSQITGIYELLPQLVPEAQKREIKKLLKENDKKIICPLSTDGRKPSNCEFVIQGNPKINKDIFEQYIMNKASYDIYYDYKKVIANTFKNGKQIDKMKEDIKQNSVFRNKILHGTDLQYNSAENVVKCFMELAFLMKLYTEISQEKVND